MNRLDYTPLTPESNQEVINEPVTTRLAKQREHMTGSHEGHRESHDKTGNMNMTNFKITWTMEQK